MENISNQQNYRNIILVGRPNVGKSSIFNFLVGKNEAYIKNEDGTTIDWRSKKVGNIIIWDTPGVFKINNMPPVDIDAVFLIVENNILTHDKELYFSLQKKYPNTRVIINKIDKGEEDYSFFKDFIKISIRARVNLTHLRNVILAKNSVQEETKKIWAIVGKPNVGKSSIINKLAKKEIHKVADYEGTTKEFLPVDIDEKILLDTPGQRKRPLFPHYSDVFGVVFIMDLKQEKQDLKIINMLQKRKKPIIVVINKIDLAQKNQIQEIEDTLKKYFDVPIIKISCMQNKGVEAIQRQINKSEANYTKRIKTSELNAWLEKEIRKIEPRLKFLTQIETAPPKFFSEFKLEAHKETMLKRRLARHFDFLGIPVEIKYKQDNFENN